MDKNSVLGLVLIGAILFGFSWYGQKQQTEVTKEKARIDSIAAANAPKVVEPALNIAPALEGSQQLAATSDSTAISKQNDILGATLAAAAGAKEEFYTIENNRMIVTLSSKGGSIASVELKDYKTYDGKPLMMFNKEGSIFDMSLYLKSQINTSNFGFVPSVKSDSTIALRLYADSVSYIEFAYALKESDYMVDFNVNMVGMDNLIQSNQRTIDITWANVSPQQERGYTYEKQYTAAAYKFPGVDDVEEIAVSDTKQETVNSKVQWVAFKQQFFSSIFVAKDDFLSAYISYKALAEGSGDIAAFRTNLSIDYTPQTSTYGFEFYFGPNSFTEMKSYDMSFQKLIPLGWGIIRWINRFIVIPTFDFLGHYMTNYGWIIFLLTIFIKLIIFPFTYKSYISMAKMRLLKPEMDSINQKYPKKDDAMKKQQELMALYSKAGVSPMGGCLPMLFQLPVLIAMFKFFPASIELRGEHFLWATDLSSYDSILTLPFTIPFYGDHVSLFALLMGVSTFLSTKINMAQSGAQNNQQLPGMAFMTTYLMPVMLVVWFNSYSCALSYYYLLSNVMTIGQTYIIRQFVDDKKLHQQMKDNAKKPRKKNKWQQRYDDMIKQQQELASKGKKK